MKLLPRRRRTVPDDHAAFAGLACEHVLLSDATTRAAVHRRGDFSKGQMPLVCLAGYQRNMSDFAGFADYFSRLMPGNWPMVLVDLPGRGRADDRRKATDYSSLADARDLADILLALGIGPAIFIGQGHGGQVVMALAAAHPLLVGGTALIDSGPVTDSRGIVRLRNNLAHLDGLRSLKATRAGFRRILGSDYPGLDDERLDALSGRTHFVDKRGRAQPLFDTRLIDNLSGISFDDVLMPRWALYDALTCAPLLLMRTQLTDQLRRETFDEMMRRRPDAEALTIAGQGSPALLDQAEEVSALVQFALHCSRKRIAA